MIIHIEGRNLPGATCRPSLGAGPYENVHVGIGDRDASFELFRGDAKAADWEVEVRVVSLPDAGYDFRGPLVRGHAGIATST